MKVTVKEKEEVIEYPCLMRGVSSGIIVLMIGDRQGVDLSKSHYSDTWKMEKFEKFEGEITLKN